MTPRAIMAVVPKSDWDANKNPVGMMMNTSISTMKARAPMALERKSLNRRAATNTMAIFTNSDGCRLIGPKRSQRCAPFSAKPTAAVSNRSRTATPQMTQTAFPAQNL